MDVVRKNLEKIGGKVEIDSAVIAAVLTGMGTDGLAGARVIRAYGGIVLARIGQRARYGGCQAP
jgi:chemotaxis response regulator CheB